MDNLYTAVSFKTSEIVTRKYSTSFTLAVKMLNAEMRKAVYSIYGFVRLADEIVDTFLLYDQQKLLDDFEIQV